MKPRFVLVSDASRARLFADRAPGRELELVEELDHQDSRARARDLMADANGRKAAGPSMGGHYGGRAVSLGSGRPGVAPDTDPKEVEAQKFAHELAHLLAAKLEQHAYETLVLVAPPHFLGLLRGVLSTEVTKHVESSVHKDLTNLPLREIQGHLQNELSHAPE